MFHNEKEFLLVCCHLDLSFYPFIFSYQYNVRMREQPEAVGPSEERAIQGVARIPLDDEQQTEAGKQQTASKQQQTAQYSIEQMVSLRISNK